MHLHPLAGARIQPVTRTTQFMRQSLKAASFSALRSTPRIYDDLRAASTGVYSLQSAAVRSIMQR